MMASTLLIFTPYGIVGKQRKLERDQLRIRQEGTTAKARLMAVRDTRARNSRDDFLVELDLDVHAAQGSPAFRKTVVVPVSPLDFHYFRVGEELPVRVSRDGKGVTPDFDALHKVR